MPSQAPLLPHVEAVWSAHWPSGSSPAGTSVQVPALPATAHDLHMPVQAVLEQTPCAHVPELQSSLPAQVPPSGRLPQLPALHELGAVQSASTAQVCRHLSSVPHMYGSQGCPEVGLHAPVPLQRNASVMVDPLHEGARHWMPAG